MRHTRKRTTRSANGKRKTVTVTFYTANAVEYRLPATPVLHLSGLSPGSHTLTVSVSYKAALTRHHRRVAVTVTKTLSVKFRVC